MTQNDASTHRHDHNPFAIAHAINSIRRPTTPRETHATELEATILTAQRLHCLYQHLRHCQPMSPAQFHSRLTGDGNLNQSQGGMCIWEGLAMGLGIPQQLFSP